MEDTAERAGALRPQARRAVAGVLALITAGALAWGGVAVVDKRSLADKDDDREAVLDLARDKVVALTTIGAATDEKSIAELLERTSPRFRKEFDAQAESFVSSLRKGKVEAVGKVDAAAVKKLDEDEASVLVAATGSVTNSSAKTAQPRYYRLAVRLVRPKSEWLVDAMEFVS